MLNKTLTILFIFILLVSNNTNSTAQNDVIQSMTESIYTPMKSGLIIREIALSQYIGSRTFYDEDGNLTELQDFAGGNQLHKRTNYTINDDGLTTNSVTFDKQGLRLSYTDFEFDADNNEIGYKTYDNSDKLLVQMVNEFDANGNLVKKSKINVPANVTRVTELEYNDEDLVSKETEYGIDGSIVEERTFLYDDDGNEIESVVQRPNGQYTRFVSTYDDNDNMVNQKWYDINGNLINDNSYEYIFDFNDNWTTRKRYAQGEMRQVDERLIGY